VRYRRTPPQPGPQAVRVRLGRGWGVFYLLAIRCMDRLIAPKGIKTGIFRCLKTGVNPGFPEQGTPQGGVVSPLLFISEYCSKRN
jgi:hypothetical protein